METDILKVVLRHLKHIVAIGKKDVAPINILCHILIFASLEILQFGLVVALDPTGLIEAHRLPTALCVILVLETILYHLELQLSHCSN